MVYTIYVTNWLKGKQRALGDWNWKSNTFQSWDRNTATFDIFLYTLNTAVNLKIPG